MPLPTGILMKEHRLIEKMIALLEEKLSEYKKETSIDPIFISQAVDFMRVYADRLHHGKEEKILFKALEKKELKTEHAEMMAQLMEEHKWGREMVKNIENANQEWRNGDTEAYSKIIENLVNLTGFYPGHIQTEDKDFFKPVMDYFSEEERQEMIREEQEFDRNFIHFTYQDKIDKWSGE
jgi:hemerythrin-like domain-containing protein